jgi:hypothetical protein
MLQHFVKFWMPYFSLVKGYIELLCVWPDAPTLHSSAYYVFCIQEVPDSDIDFKKTVDFSWLEFFNIVMFV